MLVVNNDNGSLPVSELLDKDHRVLVGCQVYHLIADAFGVEGTGCRITLNAGGFGINGDGQAVLLLKLDYLRAMNIHGL